MPTLYQSDSLDLEVRDASSHDVVWFGVRTTPDRDEIEHLCTIACMWIEHTERPLVLHIEDTATGLLNPPDMGCILCIVGRLLEHRDQLQKKLRGTCVQARRIDDPARMAKDLFLGVYQPVAPFDIVEGAAAAKAFLAKL